MFHVLFYISRLPVRRPFPMLRAGWPVYIYHDEEEETMSYYSTQRPIVPGTFPIPQGNSDFKTSNKEASLWN